MVELAADLASFNNTSIDDAIQAIRSGLSGEAEPLKRFGITLSDVRLRAEGAAQGLDTTGKSLSPLTKSMAAYSLILKDSTNAQGDFARTSDGFANQLRIIEAGASELKRAFGQGFLNALGNAGDSFGDVGQAMEDLQPLLEFFGGRAGETAKALGQIASGLINIGQAAEGAGEKFGPLGDGIDWIINDMPLFWNGFRTAGQILDKFTGSSQDSANAAWSAADAYSDMTVASYRAAFGVGESAGVAEGAWVDASGNIIDANGAAAEQLASDYQWAAEQIANAATWWSNAAWKAGQNAANAIILARGQLSGTVSSAIASAGFDAAFAFESQPPWEKAGQAVARKVGGGVGNGLKAETKIMLADWLADWSNIDVEVETKLSKAGGTLAEGYKTRLDALKAAAQAYEQTVTDSIDVVNAKVEEYSKGLSEAFLGFNLSDFVKEIKDDAGNVTGTLFDSDAFKQWLGDKESIRTGLSPLLGQIPQVWAEQIMGMDNASAKATIDWLTTSPDQVANLQTTFTQLSADVKATLSDPLAEAMRGSYWEAQMEGIKAAREVVETEAESFKKFVKKQLKTKIVIDIEYREVNSPPSAASARSTVAAVQSFEALNGRSWRA